MAAISSIGTGSGIDLEGLVTKIVEAERTPVESRLNLKQATAEASISAYGALKSTLEAFKETLSGLTEGGAVRSAISSDDSIVSIEAENEAQLTSYSIDVLNLASQHKLAISGFDSPSDTVGTGSLSISVGSASFDIDITEGENDSLSAIRDAINDASNNTGVTASILTIDDGEVTSRLVLTANKSGEDSEISVSVTDTDGQDADDTGLSKLVFTGNVEEISEAKDAQITIDGLLVKSSTNTFDSVVDGLTITANKEPEDPLEPLNAIVSVTESAISVKGDIERFVASYNEINTTLKALSSYDTTTETAGLLNGDSGVRQVETLMRRVLSQTLGESGDTFSSLASIGIITERDGSLSVDAKKLESSLDSDLDGVSKLFSNDKGIATRLSDLTTGFLNTDGIIKTKTTGFELELSQVEDRRETMERRLDAVEARYRRQFTGLDILIAQFQSTANYLTEQLSSLSSNN